MPVTEQRVEEINAKQYAEGHMLGTSPRLERVRLVMAAAARSGLLDDKHRRIGARVDAALVSLAKAHTGIETDTLLLRYALSCLVLDARFAEAFREVKGTVDPNLDFDC
jgi:hypothetical protein